MLGTAEADASCAVLPGTLSIGRIIGVGPHVEHATVVGPAEEFREPWIVDVGDFGLNHAHEHFTRGSIH